MSIVAFFDSSLLWKFKEFSSTRLSDAHDHERPGRALCGFESDPFFHQNSDFHLNSDQGLTVGKGSCDEIRPKDPDIVLTSSDDYPVGKAGPIEFDGLFTDRVSQPHHFNKTSSASGAVFGAVAECQIHPHIIQKQTNVRAS